MKKLNDTELETAVENCVRRERELVKELLEFLLELELRDIHLLRGYSSMFDYCRRKLLYSEAEAMLRISAMRLLKQAPEAGAKIQDGSLSLTVAAQVHQAARRERLPAEETKALVEELSGASKREAEQLLATRFPEKAKPEKARPISEAAVEIRFTVSKEDYALFQELLDRKAHTNFERSYAKLFTALARKERAKEDTPPQRPAAVKPCARRSRYISASPRRFVFERDKGACQMPGCKSRHGVQLDHIVEYAKGGSNEPENLRLLCGAHNRLRNRKKKSTASGHGKYSSAS